MSRIRHYLRYGKLAKVMRVSDAEAVAIAGLRAGTNAILPHSLVAANAQLERERDALATFKAYTHQRMDESGIPTHPEGEHSAQGCRIGDRFDLLVSQRDAAIRERDATREAARFHVIAEAHDVARAMNRQLAEDFKPKGGA